LYIASIQQNKVFFEFFICRAVKRKLKLLAKSINTIKSIIIYPWRTKPVHGC